MLYAWHILPLVTVAAHRDALAAADPFDQSLPLQLLKDDAEARVVVNCKFSLDPSCWMLGFGVFRADLEQVTVMQDM